MVMGAVSTDPFCCTGEPRAHRRHFVPPGNRRCVRRVVIDLRPDVRYVAPGRGLFGAKRVVWSENRTVTSRAPDCCARNHIRLKLAILVARQLGRTRR